MRPLYLAFTVLLAGHSSLAFPFSKRDSTLSLPQCLFDNASGAVAAVICSNQYNATQIADACQTDTSPACIWTFDYQGSQVTVCAQTAAYVEQELKMNNVSACVCGSTSSYNSADSQVTIGGPAVSYSSEACPGGFCPLWYSSQPSYSCAAGVPTLGDLSATDVGVIQGGVSSSQSGSALTGSATQSVATTSSGTGTVTGTVTGTATTAAKPKTTSSTSSGGSSGGGSSSSPADHLRTSFSFTGAALFVALSGLYAL